MGYKVGDTPKFIESLSRMTYGRRYSILRNNGPNPDTVRVIDDFGIEVNWLIRRFEPYKEYIFYKEMNEIISEEIT